jgi:hypothetical protein
LYSCVINYRQTEQQLLNTHVRPYSLLEMTDGHVLKVIFAANSAQWCWVNLAFFLLFFKIQ